MRRNKANNHKKTNNRNHVTRDGRDIYLPTTESSVDFDDIENIKRRENADQVRDLTGDDPTKGKNYKMLPEVTAASSLSTNDSDFYDLCSSRGIGNDKDWSSVFSPNLEEAECEITSAEWHAFSSDMEKVSPRSRRRISRSKRRTETGALENEIKLQALYNDKEPMHHSKHLVRDRINKDNKRTAAYLPSVPTPRYEKTGNLSENKKISKGRKQGFKRYEPDIGIVNGKKLSNSIAPEYHNLKPFLPLLTLCQCPDYDSAVIEVVRDYNDPCGGVVSDIYPPSDPY